MVALLHARCSPRSSKRNLQPRPSATAAASTPIGVRRAEAGKAQMWPRRTVPSLSNLQWTCRHLNSGKSGPSDHRVKRERQLGDPGNVSNRPVLPAGGLRARGACRSRPGTPPAASALTRALLGVGTTEESKLSRVLPGSRGAPARLRSVRRRPRSAISSSASAERKRAAGQPSLSARSANCGHSLAIAGRRRSCSNNGSRVGLVTSGAVVPVAPDCR